MSQCFLSNPYNPNGEDWESLRKISTRVSPVDVDYFLRTCGYRSGNTDKVLSTLFHTFITELRNLEKSNGTPFDPAWHPGHPTELILSTLLDRFHKRGLERSAAGVDIGSAGQGTSAPDVPASVDGLHLPVQPTTAKRSVQESGSD